MKNIQINWFAVIFPLLVGCPFLYVGLSEIYKTEQMLHEFVAAPGIVVDNQWQAFAQGGASYVPVVEFKTQSGQIVRFTDGVGTFPAEYEVGTEVKVLYDPEDVHKARVYSWKRIWFAPVFITFIGMLPILIGASLVWFTMCQPHRNRANNPMLALIPLPDNPIEALHGMSEGETSLTADLLTERALEKNSEKD